METFNIRQMPELMRGKQIVYVHGFASSGRSGTVQRLHALMPNAAITAPDLPIHPAEAMDLLRRLCALLRPRLIIGTSMGGMYAEMLHGYDRILVNPAFQMADTMREHGMIGLQQFKSERADGATTFMVNKALVKEYRAVTGQCFAKLDDAERQHVWGLFGDEDTTVHTFGLFASHYPQRAISFHGEHRLNDKTLVNAVMPVIRRIDDRQERRSRPIIYIDIDALRAPDGRQMSSALKAFRILSERYTLFIVARSMDYDGQYADDVRLWAKDVISVPCFGHIVFTNCKSLLYGDYLIDPHDGGDTRGFTGTHIAFGGDTFKTWEEVIEYFSHLGGQ